MSTFDIGFLTENDCEEELSIPVGTQDKANRKRKSDESVTKTVKNENITKTIKKSVYEDISKTVEYSSIQKDYKFIFNAPQVFIILLLFY